MPFLVYFFSLKKCCCRRAYSSTYFKEPHRDIAHYSCHLQNDMSTYSDQLTSCSFPAPKIQSYNWKKLSSSACLKTEKCNSNSVILTPLMKIKFWRNWFPLVSPLFQGLTTVSLHIRTERCQVKMHRNCDWIHTGI